MNPRFIQLSIVALKLITNNIVTPPLYFIFQIMDFVIQLLMLFSIFDKVHCVNFTLKQISDLLSSSGNTTIYTLLIAFGYCFILIIAIIIMIIRIQAVKKQQQQLIYFRGISGLFVFLRTFASTIIMIFLAQALPQIYETDSNRYFIVFLECSTLLQFWLLAYF